LESVYHSKRISWQINIAINNFNILLLVCLEGNVAGLKLRKKISEHRNGISQILFIYVFIFSLFNEVDIFSDYIAPKVKINIEQLFGKSGDENSVGLI
jgi:hypothetical protein